MTPRPWTGAEHQRLRQHVAAGLNDAQISALMGRTVNAIDDKRTTLKLRLVGRLWTAQRKQTLFEMFHAGATDTEIAAAIGRPRVAVRNMRSSMRLLLAELPMRGVCAGRAKRRDRIVATLSSAAVPISVPDLIPLVYEDGIGPSTADMSIRVLVHKLRRAGVPIVSVPGRLGYMMQAEGVAA